VILIAFCAFGAGCGSSEPTPGPTAGAEIQADDAQDRQIGLDLKHYLLVNCPQPGQKTRIPKKLRNSPYFPQWQRWYRGASALCASIAVISVENSRVVIRSGLEDDAKGRAAGDAFCDLIQGSDVADFTPGHELQGRNGETITVCPARSG
jgi:hypothetical protein